jgi:CheY-like chemotaxis protein
MQIKCTACEQGINIPEEQIPKDRAFSMTCPGCRAKVRVDQHLSAPSSSPQELVEPHSEENQETGNENESESSLGILLSTDFDDEEEELQIYEENDRLALILDDKNRDLWVEALEERGFKLQFAKSPEHAIHKMRFTHFHFVVLHENYGGVSLENSPVYRLLAEMPMASRRNIFFAVVGNKFKTLNNMEAFSYSVNLVINEKDKDKFSKILKKSIADHETFYKVFKESLHAMGKA